ncbi:Carboxylesterase family-domain-containing protein [Mycena olivaceomarginata]|nr:Carboxylesterase family-domain-containing protein [Mycena olivaceomarginata]
MFLTIRSVRNEDCLFFNVWQPESTSAKDKLPVLVYIYGGGYFAGAGSEWVGTSLVRSVATNKPIIWITFNYHIGALDSRLIYVIQLGSTQSPLKALNVGLQDQRVPLRWIQDNVHVFGGDGSCITISGESSGGSSVQMHYLYPDSRWTFHAGISSSGTSLTINTPMCEWHNRPGGMYNILGNVTGVIGTTFIDITPQPPIDLENSLLSSFIIGQAANNKTVSQATLAKLLTLYAHPTDNLSNSSLSICASQFETDYVMLALQRLFLKTALAAPRKQDV